jgi:hypothetical protein
MASLSECELAQLKPLFMRVIYTIWGVAMLIILSCTICLALFCCRRKPASVRREQGDLNLISRGVAVSQNYIVQGTYVCTYVCYFAHANIYIFIHIYMNIN